jgi:hypothetical protein
LDNINKDNTSGDTGATTEPRHKGRYRFVDRSFFFSQALLFDDRLEFRGWNWTERYLRVIRLEHIRQVIWLEGQENCNLELRLKDGEIVGLWVKRAGQWKVAIEGLLGEGASGSGLYRLPEAQAFPDPVRVAV